MLYTLYGLDQRYCCYPISHRPSPTYLWCRVKEQKKHCVRLYYHPRTFCSGNWANDIARFISNGAAKWLKSNYFIFVYSRVVVAVFRRKRWLLFFVRKRLVYQTCWLVESYKVVCIALSSVLQVTSVFIANVMAESKRNLGWKKNTLRVLFLFIHVIPSTRDRKKSKCVRSVLFIFGFFFFSLLSFPDFHDFYFSFLNFSEFSVPASCIRSFTLILFTFSNIFDCRSHQKVSISNAKQKCRDSLIRFWLHRKQRTAALTTLAHPNIAKCDNVTQLFSLLHGNIIIVIIMRASIRNLYASTRKLLRIEWIFGWDAEK